MNMMMISSKYYTNSIIVRVGRTWCCPNAKPEGSFSFSLRFSNRRRKRRSFSIHSESIFRGHNNTVSALNSGLEASITDATESSNTLKKASIVLESGDENKIQLRVDLTGDQTERVFGKTLRDLGRTAPPVPGFRMQKGGKSSQIPNDFLLQMLGEERVIKFVIQEILNSTMADYVEKENLDVKDRKISTIQTAEELKQSFKPGKEFGFNVIIEPKSSEDTG
ncbi:uncharacterized protein LOC130940727 [Arachis stenosperma]|uniref:uncharacterized protein LOC130938928 n=1 Tax=Arachis stenosperma TaxID=217475 RepID=UPI0025AC4739|nr:uncharacterized protein LOC130938928 [Arachis stenosperma]XP_057724938.1 uncharacterized protein LOC130940727 [Arachis stenosperma]